MYLEKKFIINHDSFTQTLNDSSALKCSKVIGWSSAYAFQGKCLWQHIYMEENRKTITVTDKSVCIALCNFSQVFHLHYSYYFEISYFIIFELYVKVVLRFLFLCYPVCSIFYGYKIPLWSCDTSFTAVVVVAVVLDVGQS